MYLPKRFQFTTENRNKCNKIAFKNQKYGKISQDFWEFYIRRV